MKLTVLIVLSLLSAVAAETQFVVFTDPPGASIYDAYGNYLNQAGEQLSVELPPKGYVELTLEAEGYQTKVEAVPVRVLKETGRWPPEGAVALAPASLAVRFNQLGQELKPSLFVLAPLALFLVVIASRRHNRLKRSAERGAALEDLKVRAGADSLAMHILGGYRLVEKLGAGGMASVYRGVPDETLSDSRAVAVKVLSAQEIGRPGFEERFGREVRACAQLQHPRLVSLIDWGQDEDATYLVFELLEGQTLRDRMDSPYCRSEAMEWLSQVAEGIQFAHDNGIIHRDLKPENIMLTRFGVKLMDFGLARAEDSARVTKTGEALGTPAYMAPEQILGVELGPHTDQYAFGCLAYELLLGRPPFDFPDALALVNAHLNSDPPEPNQLQPGFPDGASQVLMAMLSKDVENRYSSVAEAFAALRDHYEGPE